MGFIATEMQFCIIWKNTLNIKIYIRNLTDNFQSPISKPAGHEDFFS